MAIAVLGMHRSGTSMVTRMLAACGLRVGPAHELLAATSENPTGYWERRPMVLLNDGVLDMLGLAWDHMPAVPPAGWERDAQLEPAVAEARSIIASFPSDELWGWKDPRTSVTLPLWERAMDDARADVVLCVRNPLDVAASLAKRGGTSARLAFELWHAYSESALALARDRRHVVTHYDAHFEDARGELVRICASVGLTPTEGELATAATGAVSEHRHAHSGLAALVRSGARDETVALYLELLHASGPVMARVAGRDEMVVASDGAETIDRADTAAFIHEFRVEQGLTPA